MIKNIKYIFSKNFNPYNNLALEEYLFHQVNDGECILYLWQNENTVVIGKNQNAWKECKFNELEDAGGKIVRRLSGGGAVFHDLGNLNFTFLVKKEDYDLEKQLQVIINAVRNLGINAVKSGRNDITVDGRKFSGNAFYSDGSYCYHHGTILINVDMNKLSKYLNVSRDKLVAKGVESVKSRVINLSEYRNDLTIERMKKELIIAFEEVYKCVPSEMNQENFDNVLIDKLYDKFSSWDWIFGKRMEMTYSIGRRYEWGGIDIQLRIEAGKIVDSAVYSDAMDTSFIESLPLILKNCIFSSKAITDKLENISTKDQMVKLMIKDIVQMFLEEGI